MEISLTKNLERKKKKEKKNRRMPLCNLTIQLVANVYTKFEVSILNRCADIFDEKSGEKKKEQI